MINVSAATENEELSEYEDVIVNLGEKLPVPTGWKILVAVPKADEKTKGGIIKPKEAMHIEEIGTIIGLVLRMGDMAYRDDGKRKFPTGAWCKEGDYIMMRSYSGTRFVVSGTEFRLINDDTVEAVIEDPRGVEKVL